MAHRDRNGRPVSQLAPLRAPDARDRRAALRVAAIYAVFGSLWIIFSDRLLALALGEAEDITLAQTFKGWFYVLVTAALVYLLVLGHIRALHSSQRRVEASEERYRQIVETSVEGIGTINADEDPKITFVNTRLAEMLGYTPAEMLGHSALEFMDEEWRAVIPELRRTAVDGQVRSFDFKFRRRDGSNMWALVSASRLYGDQGEQTGTLVMVTDITERKRLEEQLRHAQKMEAVGQLAGGVSHDFNNILTAILGHVELMRDVLKGGQVTPSLDENLDQIERSSQRAAVLTRQLLAFSRRQVIQPEVLNLHRVVHGVHGLLRRLIRENIELQIECATHVWPVHADAGQLEQVIVNLAVNARDAMSGGGRLAVGAENVVVEADHVAQHPEAQPGPHVRLRVTDTGAGIAADVLPHIFEPFFTTKPVGEGTGLGLATVDGIVRQLHGHIVVDTAVGRGTTFDVYLPALSGVAQPTATEAEPAAVLTGRETVLVCDDDAAVRGLTCGALKSHGYAVLEAAQPEEAVETAGRHGGEIHLLITDVALRGLNGRELAQRLARERPHMGVLYVSGFSSDVLAQHGVLAPGIAFLAKPFRAEDLLRRVREVLDRRATEADT